MLSPLFAPQCRLLRGSRNKAERGELFLHVAIGYHKTSSGEIVQEPDEQARGMVQLVFDKFEELGSAYAVFRYFVANQLQLGFRPQSAAHSGKLEWRLPTPNCVLGILRRPIYAGAYAYGIHRPGTKNPVTGCRQGGKWFLPPEEIPVLLQDRLPVYISWEQYLAIKNASSRIAPSTSHAGRPGVAPLCCKAWSCASSSRRFITGSNKAGSTFAARRRESISLPGPIKRKSVGSSKWRNSKTHD
jgi:hypothetical protein